MTTNRIVKQFTKYGGVAAGSAGADWIVFTALEHLGSGYLIAQVLARITGGVFSFVVNKNWSFDKKGGHILVQGRRFLALYIFSYCVSLGLILTFVEGAGLNPYPAKLLSDIVCFVVNFVAMRNYVFSGRAGFTDYIRGGLVALRNRDSRNAASPAPDMKSPPRE